jgi:glycosyltransferase involved in cell wall biosynthesis
VNIKLIYRKPKLEFNSIENVFDTLIPFLKVDKIELPYFSQGFFFRLKNVLFTKKLKANLYHITGNDHYLILGLKKRKTILTIHDIEVLKRSSGLKHYLLKKIWFDLPIKHASAITTISHFSKNEILSLGNYKKSIEVIYNPLTLPIKYKPKEFNQEQPNVLHIGTKQNKNLNRLIEALNGINCHLTIIGTPNDEQLIKLKQNKIIYTIKSNLNNDQVVSEYENCDILSFVSTYEGFGLPIIEAQACGRVVLTSNLASIPEVAKDGAYFVDPFDSNEIKKGILELINNPILRIKLIEKGFENIKRFEPQKVANQYNELYSKINNEK